MSVSSNKLKENSRDFLREEEEEETGDDEVDHESPFDEEFQTTSIRVLLVDSDYNSLRRMKNLLTQFSYQVKIFRNGDDAIAFLMKNKHEIDLVIWDEHVPVVYGLEDVINTINKDMDLPVVIISHEYNKETVMKSTEYGACDFLVKPVSKEVVAVLRQHVYRKKMSRFGYGSVEEGSKNVVEDSGEQKTAANQTIGDKYKKERMVWARHPELHQAFEMAVSKLGIDKATPKKILESMEEDMGVQGLTRDQVASHLQTYRQNAGAPHETRQDSSLRNAGPYTALLNSSFSRVPYFTNDEAAANAHETREDSCWGYADEQDIVYTDYEPKPLLDSSFNKDQAATTGQETGEDCGWRYAESEIVYTDYEPKPLLDSGFSIDQAGANAQETREDYGWRYAEPEIFYYEPKPLLDSSFNLHAREPYFTNDQATARALIQYPSTIYLTMNNSSYMTNHLPNLPHTDSFHQPQQQRQQQQYDDSYLQLPSVIPTQVSSAMQNLDLSKFPPGNFDL